MGFPLSRFQMLSRLCSYDEDVRNILSPYKLKCIVLHDPDDKRFTAKMKGSFLRLHERTGKDLLFITFIEPPKEWNYTDRPALRIVDPQRLCAESGFDSWLIVRHLLPAVAPDADLPCLLLTEDLLSRKFVLLNSSIDRFEEQLTRLGEFCSQAGEQILVSDRHFLEFASMLGTCHLSELTDRSLAATLTDVLALQVLSDADSDSSRDAERWAEQRIYELKTVGGNTSPESFRYESAVKKERKRRESSLPVISKKEASHFREAPRYRPQRPDTEISPTLYASYRILTKGIRNYSLCDVRSRDNIMEYNDLLEMFVPKRTRDEEKVAFIDRHRSSPRSFKQLAQPLAEFFEREINLSLVQLMRQHVGIEMPEFYRKYKQGCEVYVTTRKASVPLNAWQYPDRLRFVMLGNAFHAYKVMCDRYGPYQMPERMGSSFLEEWYQMVSLRNTIDHPDYYEDDFFGYQEFRRFHEVFTSILQNSLWKMEAIGSALRVGAELPEFY